MTRLPILLTLVLLAPPLFASAQVDLGGAHSAVHAGALTLEAGAGCEPQWLPGLGWLVGTNEPIWAMTVFAGGSGPALYAGGEFDHAGSVSAAGIARWDGASFSALQSGVTGTVLCATVFDDGSGPALYVGGSFTNASGSGAVNIARWDGAGWSALGAGADGAVRALAVFDDGQGGGAALFAGGDFVSVDGVVANHIARWDGTSWSSLGVGLRSSAHALAVHDDGSGVALHVGGSFTQAGGLPASRAAKWDGSAWSALGTGTNNTILALASFGGLLYAGGEFSSPGTRIARWDGSAWTSASTGISTFGGPARAFTVYDDGGPDGPTLYAGGDFNISSGGVSRWCIGRWNGTRWHPVGSGVDGDQPRTVGALAAYDDGSGAELFLGGKFERAYDAPPSPAVSNVAKWDGTSFHALLGADGMDGTFVALLAQPEGPGGEPTLYAAGDFLTVRGVSASRIASWSVSTGWSSLGSGLDAIVFCLALFDDGSGGGPELYAGGSFSTAGGTPASRIAKWDGSAWSPLQGGGLDGAVVALAVFDDGNGPALYVGGTFSTAGGQPASRIARWDGSSWSPLGSGMSGGTTLGVYALAVYDDGGGGPDLYAAGSFDFSGGVQTNRIARWDGSTWSPLGSGIGNGFSQSPRELTVLDDGSGPALIVGGWFPSGVAKWTAAGWQAMGHFGSVEALAVYDDGTGYGARLYAGGTNRCGRWDGDATWTLLGTGWGGHGNPTVNALAPFDDGSGGGSMLYAGGSFTISPANDSYLTRYGGCAIEVGSAYCFGDGSGTPCPCGNTGGPGEGCANSSGSGAVLSGTGMADTSADTLSLRVSGMVGSQPGLLFQGDDAIGLGQGAAFGDGLRCAGGNAVRIAILFPSAWGNAFYPGPGEPSISSLGDVQPGQTYRYQFWYRDVPAGPCATGFNLSNGLAIGWQ